VLTGKHSNARGGLTASHEHYLRAIWEVRSQRGYARLADVARELGVAPPTISVGVRPLIARGLVTHDEHHFLVLTPAGVRAAREAHHRFAVMHVFLRDVLGVRDDAARAEACALEHDVSGGTVERVLDLLKLLRGDAALRSTLRERLAGYRRDCRPAIECSTCALDCMSEVPPPV
jgi:DtxR family Mn-dependent transcriptional regulator